MVMMAHIAQTNQAAFISDSCIRTPFPWDPGIPPFTAATSYLQNAPCYPPKIVSRGPFFWSPAKK